MIPRLLKSFARLCLQLRFRKNQTYTISLGPLHGMKLSFVPSVNYHELLGLAEWRSFRFLKKALFKTRTAKNEMVIVDAGANIGLYSMWFSRAFSRFRNVQIHAFEPIADTANILTHHLDLNGIRNVAIAQTALADKTGSIQFELTGDSHSARIASTSHTQRLTVPMTTLDDYFFGKTPRTPPDFIKMDIEGAGKLALKGCDKCVAAKRPIVYIESHDPEEDKAIGDFLIRHGYSAYRNEDGQWIRDFTKTHPHPDGVWGKLLLCPDEIFDAIQKAVA